jgi:hypothetical protein
VSGPAPRDGVAAVPPARTEVATLEDAPLLLPVPYGDGVLEGPRMEAIRQLMAQLDAEGFRGLVEVRSFAARFCLVGNALDGYALAPDDVPFARCDLVGNPDDEDITPAQRVSLPFVNLAGEYRTRTQGVLDLRHAVGDPSQEVAEYPPVTAELTAGEWNRAARANSRIEIRIL